MHFHVQIFLHLLGPPSLHGVALSFILSLLSRVHSPWFLSLPTRRNRKRTTKRRRTKERHHSIFWVLFSSLPLVFDAHVDHAETGIGVEEATTRLSILSCSAASSLSSLTSLSAYLSPSFLTLTTRRRARRGRGGGRGDEQAEGGGEGASEEGDKASRRGVFPSETAVVFLGTFWVLHDCTQIIGWSCEEKWMMRLLLMTRLCRLFHLLAPSCPFWLLHLLLDLAVRLSVFVMMVPLLLPLLLLPLHVHPFPFLVLVLPASFWTKQMLRKKRET